MTAEHQRLEEARAHGIGWKRWGPYLSERQWGTVREDLSENGDAWNSFSHDQARSCAYRWGEDGLAGFSDHKQRVCFALALWNGCDPILKERLFGLTNSEGNHGEDVKEYYFYLDSTPTHSYMKYLYKYPQTAFPYGDLVETNRRRGRTEQEYELLDTGAFDDDRYFDVFVEFAKETPSDILIKISACNRGPQPACLHLLPTLWFRNQWTWNPTASRPAPQRSRTFARTRSFGRSNPRSARFACIAKESLRCCLPKTRPIRCGCSGLPTGPLRQGRIQRISRPGPAGSRQPGPDGYEGSRPLLSHAFTRRVLGRSAEAVKSFRSRRRRPSLRRLLRQPVRAGTGDSEGRSRRILCGRDPALLRRGRGQSRPPSAGRNVVEQAVLFVRRR